MVTLPLDEIQLTRPIATELSFNNFLLNVRLRKLTYRGESVPVRSRAFDILSTLALRSGEAVSKDEIISAVWPEIYVDDGALRVHMNSLRKVLRSFCPEELIATIAGRGYMLTAKVEPSEFSEEPIKCRNRLPWLPFELLGREDVIDRWSAEGPHRICTIVGASGAGKSSVALALARKLSDAHFQSAFYVDLRDKRESVLQVLATAVGYTMEDRDRSAFCEFLSRERRLIVLDGLRHDEPELVETIDYLLAWTPNLSIVASCNEPLGCRGERIKVLTGLATPPESGNGNPMSFPAVSLFTAVAAGVTDDKLDDPDTLEQISEIVTRLEGRPVAIEAAARAMQRMTINRLQAVVCRSSAPPIERAPIAQWNVASSTDPVNDPTFRMPVIIPDGSRIAREPLLINRTEIETRQSQKDHRGTLRLFAEATRSFLKHDPHDLKASVAYPEGGAAKLGSTGSAQSPPSQASPRSLDRLRSSSQRGI